MRLISKRIFLLALSALMALSFSLALPMVALAEGVTIAGDSTVTVGATLDLTAACTDHTGAAFTWSSSDTAVATVDAASGVVSAVAEGNAEITATCSGAHANGDGSATKTITVQAAAATPTPTAEPTATPAPTAEPTATPTAAPTQQLPSMSLSASATSFTATGATGTVTATVANPGTGTWNFTAKVTSGSAVTLESYSADADSMTVQFKTKKEGKATLSISAQLGDVTLTKTVDITVDLPDPYLRLTTDHSTLSMDRTKTKVKATLYNANADVPEDSRIYWSTSNSSVAKVTAGSKYMDDAEAYATVYARGNGKAIITARTNDGHVVDTIEIVVKNYKSIPQTGQNTTLIALEVAALGAILVTAGVVYARRRNQKEG